MSLMTLIVILLGVWAYLNLRETPKKVKDSNKTSTSTSKNNISVTEVVSSLDPSAAMHTFLIMDLLEALSD